MIFQVQGICALLAVFSTLLFPRGLVCFRSNLLETTLSNLRTKKLGDSRIGIHEVLNITWDVNEVESDIGIP
jgi:hypothetical protein